LGKSGVVRRTATLVLLLAAGIAAAVVAVVVLSGRDTARDVAGSLGLVDDPPFRLELSGRLWQDRTLRSEDGAPDLAHVTGNEPLAVLVSGKGGARVSNVELRVDGRRQRLIRAPCPAGRCPTSLRLAFEPRLGAATGDRRIQVVARDPHARRSGTHAGSHIGSASFTVHRGPRLPLVREGEPVTATAAPSKHDETRLRRLRLRALRVIAATRVGGVPAVLRSGFRVRETGELTLAGRRLGATLLLDLTPTRRNVSITLPAYFPASGGITYRLQNVRMRAAMLRDVLVDVDLERDRVVALEPGPRSQTKTWAPSRRSTPAGAADED
jgi:hypothetical protein